ncbi:topoisomerase DNA-binding C4 zinc finger domain-containing protein, partial [candidate division WWE3 bacterium]|nr:topoisomerase DNA-binding C4 zinc finger domain-containing protein [candidate division WWE3 bacterium]
IEQHKETYKRTSKEIERLQEQKGHLISQAQNLSSNIVKEAKVLATTLTKSYTAKNVLEREYDCVIVDEASMAPLPALWCAAGLARQKVIIVGDFYQLPPIAKHEVLNKKDVSEEVIRRERELVDKWLKRDIFKLFGIVDQIKACIKPDGLEQLQRQYRMHPNIAGVINYLVYAKACKKFQLESAKATEKNGKALLMKEPLSGAQVGIYDTSEIKAVPTRTDTGSYYNLYQARLAVSLAQQAVDSGYKEVGIVSPFRAQTNLIQKMVKDEELSYQVVADTVHRFQGGERDLIIFDLTTPRSTKLTDDQEDEGDDEKLINVAFSRAKDKIVILMDVPGVEGKHTSSSLLKRFITYSREHSIPLIPAQGIIHEYQLLEGAEKWLKKINKIDELQETLKSSIYDEVEFYPAFINDLLTAKAEVIIDSPYITTERVQKLVPIFAHLIAKGIKVFVLTRQAKEHTGKMQLYATQELKNLEDLGIIILPFVGNIHRKLAIIDRRVLWEGSLNILSQRDSKEVMRRFVGETTAKQMITFLKIDKNVGKLGENRIDRCSTCRQPGAWYWIDKSRFGYWKFCLIGRHKVGDKPKTQAQVKAAKAKVSRLRKSRKERTAEGIPICPEHKVAMVLRNGRFGKFYGCPQWPRCPAIEKIKETP